MRLHLADKGVFDAPETTETYRYIDNQDIYNRVSAALNSKGVAFDFAATGEPNNTKVVMEFALKNMGTTLMGDGIIPQLNIINSYNKECSLKIQFGAFRLICSNGLTIGETFFSEKIIHRTGSTFEEKIKKLDYQIAAFIDRLEFLSDLEDELSVTLTEETMINITGNLRIPTKAKHETITRIFDRKRSADQVNNIWMLLNLANEAITDTVKSKKARTCYNQSLLGDILALAA